jgi:hypothetical protein
MNCFIKIVDGQPFEHPILEDNFRQAFPEIDPDNLPEGFARFTRITKPAFKQREFKYVHYLPNFIPCEGGWTDDWGVRDMTEEEKAVVIERATNITNDSIAQLIASLREEISNSTDAVAIRVLTEYVGALEAFTFTDPFNHNMPAWPAKNEDGSYVDTSA